MQGKEVLAPEARFEIPTVSKELYFKTRESLAKEGYTFVVNIESLSIGQLATDAVTGKRFDYVSPSVNMRSIIPQQMEVVINPNNLRIKNSNSQPTGVQIAMIREEEARLKGTLPQEIRDIISMRMQSASALAQLDAEYQKETGKVLFTDWSGGTDDRTVPGFVVGVGRGDPSRRLGVSGWLRGSGSHHIFAVPVVVLPRKLAA